MEEPVGPKEPQEPVNPTEPNFPFAVPEPLTEIEKVRGSEQAYYEGSIEECENMINKLEEELEGEDRRHTSPVQGSRDAPPDIDEEHMSPRARDLFQRYKSKGENESIEDDSVDMEIDECPVCGKADFANDGEFEKHIDKHWAESSGPSD